MILAEHDADRVRRLTLDRPEALNAFTPALFDAVAGALTEAAADPEIGCVVLTGVSVAPGVCRRDCRQGCGEVLDRDRHGNLAGVEGRQRRGRGPPEPRLPSGLR